MVTTAHPTSVAPSTGIDRFFESDLAQEVQFLAARTRARGSSHANALLGALDLKVRHYSVLSLAASNLQPSQRELAVFLGLDPSQIVALVDELQKRDLVRRETDPQDRRSKIIVATEEGHQLYQEAKKITAFSEDETLATLSNRERKLLRELLIKVAF